MRLRSKQGATLGLAVVLLITIVMLGLCCFFLARLLGGSKQATNAADAGALTAARSMLSVAVPAANIAPAFQGLGVAQNGAPDPVNGIYNIFAYNRAAGLTTVVAMNALEDGSTTAIQNAETLIGQLKSFGTALNTAILNNGRLGYRIASDFEKTASENNVNMMGAKSVIQFPNNLTFQSVPTGTGSPDLGKANVYFNSAMLPAKSQFAHWANTLVQDNSGTIKSAAVTGSDPSAPSYEVGPLYQAGQPLCKAYVPINILPNQTTPIYFAAVNPASQPHLIDVSRFNSGQAQYGYAPVNSVQGKTLTTGTNKANTNISAMACAVIGSLYNEYPIMMINRYVRIRNLPDALTANPGLQGIVAAVDGSQNIFNNELCLDPPVGCGIYATNNDVFFTKASNGLAEAQAYVTYNASANQTGVPKDGNGRYPLLDPAVGKGQTADIQKQYADLYASNPYAANPFYPYNANGALHYGSGANQLATLPQLLAITSIPAYCWDNIYDGGMWAGDKPPSYCTQNLATWSSNYNNQTYNPKSPSTNDFTNLEALKAEIMTKWDRIATQDFGNVKSFDAYTWTSNGQFPNPSGSKQYNRAPGPYGVPHSIPSAAFGKVVSPYQLMKQVYNNGGTCINPDDATQWADPTQMLGKLLIRCQQIAPGTTWTTVQSLLQSSPIDLNKYQYIYSPDGGLTLSISTTPPNFLKGTSEYTTPGKTLPDGSTVLSCTDNPFTDAMFNQLNSVSGQDGNEGTITGSWGGGDAGLHGCPFYAANGTVSTGDFVHFQLSSGSNNILGEISFGNNVAANVTFSQPN